MGPVRAQATIEADIANVRAAIQRLTGTTTEGGAQQYGQGGTNVTRVQMADLEKRLHALNLEWEAVVNGGMVRYPVFEVRE